MQACAISIDGPRFLRRPGTPARAAAAPLAHRARLPVARVVAIAMVFPWGLPWGSAGTLAADPLPPGKAVRILSPRFFPGWQARDASHPFVVPEAPGRYRMYYSGSGAEQHNQSVWDQWVTGHVTSTDTLAWRFPESYEPVLFARKLMEGELLDPEDLAARFDSVCAVGACIVRDGAAWKAWYTGWNGRTEHAGSGLTKKVEFRIGHATSPDGLRWVKADGSAGAGAVLGLGEPGGPDSRGAAHPHVLKEGGTYRMWYEGYDGNVWRLLHATSPDGRAWTKRGVALDLGGSGSLDELGLRNPLVLERKGRYELWYQGQSRGGGETASASFHVLRALSKDGLEWTKAGGEVALHPDPPISGGEQVLVDSAMPLPGGALQVFFARQLTTSRAVTNGTIIDRNFHIYTEVVDP